MGDRKRYVVGVDGGGTKTHALLVGMDGTVVAERHGGPTNLRVVGSQNSCKVLFEVIHECCTSAEVTADSIERVVIGLAGAGRPADRSALVDLLSDFSARKKYPLRNIMVETDATIALEAALAGHPGIVLIAGTGSIALCRTEDGRMIRTGGWGSLLGDEGSGYAIARDALQAIVRQHDGRGEKTILTPLVLEHLGVSMVEDLVPRVYSDHAEIASIAPKVFDAAASRDRVAHQILLKNATDLLEHVRILTIQARPKRRLPLVLMGGLLQSENVYSKMVKEKITHSLPHVVIQRPKFPAAFGAAIIGLHAFR